MNTPTPPPEAERDSNANRQALNVLALLAGLSLLLGWAYWPTLLSMVDRWSNDPQYSHGFLVPIFALIVLWSRKSAHPAVTFSINWWGLTLIGIACLFRLFAALLFLEFLDTFSLLPMLLGLCLLLSGTNGLRWAWPGIVFLIFMMPAPYQMETALAHPLQRLATVTSTYLLQTVGLPAICEGNIILLKDLKLGVVEACSGLGMLVTFFALSTAVALVIQRSFIQRLILFISAIPIALITNIVRITLTGILYVTAGDSVARAVFHDLAGWLMMPLALFLLWLEIRFLSHLFLPVDETGPLPLGIPTPEQESLPSTVDNGTRSASPYAGESRTASLAPK